MAGPVFHVVNTDGSLTPILLGVVRADGTVDFGANYEPPVGGPVRVRLHSFRMWESKKATAVRLHDFRVFASDDLALRVRFHEIAVRGAPYPI